MTKSEAEELFIQIAMSGEDEVDIKMSLRETNIFRILIGRSVKEMEKKNRSLWLKAKEYAIQYVEPYAVVKKIDRNKYKMFAVKDGTRVPFSNQDEIKEEVGDEA